MLLHIDDLEISFYNDSHNESVKTLNKKKIVTLDINFYLSDEPSKEDDAKRELDESIAYEKICKTNMPITLITSKHNYNWIFEGVKLIDFKKDNKINKFYAGKIIETKMTFEFDNCFGTKDFTATKRTITLNKLGI